MSAKKSTPMPPKTKAKARKSRATDPDILVLKACCRALNKSRDRAMLKANLNFIIDYYCWHPSPELPAHLKP